MKKERYRKIQLDSLKQSMEIVLLAVLVGLVLKLIML